MSAVLRTLQTVLDERGSALELRDRLAEGGEGSVHPIESDRTLLAKLYKGPGNRASSVQARKIRRLAAMRSERLCQVAAWPIDVLTDVSGEPVGFSMEYLAGWVPLYSIYQVKSRVQIMPGRDWSFLVRVAKNLSACVHFVHEAGLVVGDLNESNVLVSGTTMVKLIDVDSFQVNVDGEVLTVGVGKSELTAPELQGRSLDGEIRTPEQDCFSLAILLFETLVLGRHPFAGRPTGSVEPTLEECIQCGFYAYSDRRDMPIEPPPALSLEFLPARVREIFERSFSLDPATRPTAGEWYAALDELEAELVVCAESPTHRYSGAMASCPWCYLEKKWRILLFSPARVVGKLDTMVALDSVWREIDSIVPPIPRQFPVAAPPQASFKAPLRHQVGGVCRTLLLLPIYFISLVITGINHAEMAPWVIGFLAAYAGVLVGYFYSGLGSHYGRLRKRANDINKELDELRYRWNEMADGGLYQRRLEQLAAAKERLLRMGEREEELRRTALKQAYGHHLDGFLRKFSLTIADVSSTSEDLQNLIRAGFDSAAAIDAAKLHHLKGRNERLHDELLAWRTSLERQYWQSSSHQLNASGAEAIRLEVEAERRELTRELRYGKEELESLVRSIGIHQPKIAALAMPLLGELTELGPEIEAYRKLNGAAK